MVRGLEMTDDKWQIKSLLVTLHEMSHRNLSFVICHLSFLNPEYLTPSIRLL